MAKLFFHDKQHIQKMLAYERTIANIFNEFITSVSPQLKKWTDTGKTNVWIRNGGVENFIDKKLLQLQANLLNVISNFQMDAWKRSNLKNDELVKQYIKGMSISETVKKGLFSQNLDVLKEFQQRKINGMNLSGNVWDLADQTKTQLEFYLESGLSVGRSAATIGQDIRQILKDPDKQFHRIWQKDEDGNKTKLVLSKPMKDYHPGQGKYRSSAMNAKRVAVTETNMMYRKADSERWAELDFVLGFEVGRSGSHRGACKICDAMAGEYPKGFVFTGWHPFCICVATPILMDHKDFADYLLTDHLPVDKYVTTIPERTRRFIERNTNYLDASKPYWVRDNFKDGRVSPDYVVKVEVARKIIESVRLYAGQMDETSRNIADKLDIRVTSLNLKSETRIMEKAMNEYSGDILKVRDMIRNTFVSGDLDRVLKEIKEQFDVVKIKEQNTLLGYTGTLVNVKYPNGVWGEIQVNSPQMIYAKEKNAKVILGDELYNKLKVSGIEGGKGHEFYEEWRKLSPIKEDELKRMREIEKMSVEYYNQIRKIKL